MELPSIFVSILTDEDWQAVPDEVGKKIEKFVSEKFEEFITSKALLETKHFNTGKPHYILPFKTRIWVHGLGTGGCTVYLVQSFLFNFFLR